MSHPTRQQHSTEVFKLEGKIVAKTKSAILFAIYPTDLRLTSEQFEEAIKARDPDVECHWFPLSQTKAIKEIYDGASGALDSITVTMWIAKAKGII